MTLQGHQPDNKEISSVLWRARALSPAVSSRQWGEGGAAAPDGKGSRCPSQNLLNFLVEKRGLQFRSLLSLMENTQRFVDGFSIVPSSGDEPLAESGDPVP